MTIICRYTREILLGTNMSRTNISRLLLLATAASGLPQAISEGFRSPTLGAQGLGLSGGRRAFIDDASAAWHQPSNLSDLASWQVAAEPTFVHHSVEYSAPGGLGSAKTVDPWKFLPSVFVGGRIDDHWAAGLSLTSPYGLGIKWDESGAFRYTAPYDTSLQTINVSPTVAYKFDNGLSVAAGVDVMWGELNFKQWVPWQFVAGVPGLPDGQVAASGDGVAVGGNVSATWRINEKQRLVASVRLPMDLDFDGRLDASQVPLMGNASFDFASALKMPTTVSLGYGHRCSERFTVQTDFEWLQFSRFETLPIRVATPPGLTLPGLGDIPQNWKDTYTAGITGEWKFDDAWRLRGGYQYFKTPVPDYTMSPMIPDSNQHVATVGVAWRTGHHRLDVSYAHVFYEDREITSNQNNFYLGRYELSVHLISAAYGYSF